MFKQWCFQQHALVKHHIFVWFESAGALCPLLCMGKDHEELLCLSMFIICLLHSNDCVY